MFDNILDFIIAEDLAKQVKPPENKKGQHNKPKGNENKKGEKKNG